MPPIKSSDVSVRKLIIDAQKALVAEALAKQKQKHEAEGSSSLALPSHEVLEEALIGNYEASYLGSVSVPGPEGETLADEALKQCLSKKSQYNGIFLQISTEGIYVIDALTYEREEYVLAHVSFSCVCGK